MSLSRYDGHPVCSWMIPRLVFARSHGWRGVVISGQRTGEEQLRAAHEYSLRVGQPVSILYPSGPLASNHVGTRWPRGAVDVTDPHGLQQAMVEWRQRGRTRPLVGNGEVLANDPSHFSRNGR
jgi:hypothetical protein